MNDGKSSEKSHVNGPRVKVVIYAAIGIAAFFIILLSIEPIASLGDPAPPGRLIHINGADMHIYCTGEGSPTVILDAGLGQGVAYWLEVQEAVAEHVRVCSYDRPGMGWSESGEGQRTYMKATEELHALLRAAGEEGPFVLAGHSAGAHTVRFFVQEYPDKVAGIFLEDAAYEDVLTQEALAPGVQAMWSASLAAKFGYFRINEAAFDAMAGMEIPHELRPYLHVIFNSKTFAATADELAILHVTAAELEPTKREGSWGDLPAIVITADNEASRMMGLHEHHRELAALSTRGEHVVVQSSHAIHTERPQVVIEAILRVVESVTEPAPAGDTFTVDVLGERFSVRATDPETIGLLMENYEGENSMHVTGRLVRGDGGFNSPWSLHLHPDTVRMAEVSIELCDGTPGMVEEDLQYWLESVQSYCPWASKVVEIPE